MLPLLVAIAAAAPLRVYISGEYAPLHYTNEGRLVGFEPDLALALGRQLGRDVVFVGRKETGLGGIDSVAKGKADVAINAITPTPERRALVDFTQPYVRLDYWMVQRPGRPQVRRLEELAGKRIAVPAGPALDFAKAKLAGAEIVPVKSATEAIEALSKEGGPDFALDEAPGLALAVSDGRVMLLELVPGHSTIAMAVPRGGAAPYNAALTAVLPGGLWKNWREQLEVLRPEPSLFDPVATPVYIVARKTSAYTAAKGILMHGKLYAGDLLPEGAARAEGRIQFRVGGVDLWVPERDVASLHDAVFVSRVERPKPDPEWVGGCTDGPCGCLPPDHHAETYIIEIAATPLGRTLGAETFWSALESRSVPSRRQLAGLLVTKLCGDSGYRQHRGYLEMDANCWSACEGPADGEGCCDCWSESNFAGSAQAFQLVEMAAALAEGETKADDLICRCLSQVYDPKRAPEPWRERCEPAP